MLSHPSLHIGYTTVAHAQQAVDLARLLVEQGLVACVQVEGPIGSYYVWEGQLTQAAEYRLVLKYPAQHAAAVAAQVAAHHPYATPQWVAVPCVAALPAYAQWVHAATGNKD
jgi:periplasmic divalent cation tolerance protein